MLFQEFANKIYNSQYNNVKLQAHNSNCCIVEVDPQGRIISIDYSLKSQPIQKKRKIKYFWYFWVLWDTIGFDPVYK